MDFNLGKQNQEITNIFDNIKILETTVETLNQQIKNNPNNNSSNNGPSNEKLNTIYAGITLTNNKLDYMNKTITERFSRIEDKLNILEKNHKDDLTKIDKHLEKNTIILEFLKTTVSLLNETIDILKNNEKNK